ncbi:hypothetical protein YC2023_037590 [Brassica napus]
MGVLRTSGKGHQLTPSSLFRIGDFDVLFHPISECLSFSSSLIWLNVNKKVLIVLIRLLDPRFPPRLISIPAVIDRIP